MIGRKAVVFCQSGRLRLPATEMRNGAVGPAPSWKDTPEKRHQKSFGGTSKCFVALRASSTALACFGDGPFLSFSTSITQSSWPSGLTFLSPMGMSLLQCVMFLAACRFQIFRASGQTISASLRLWRARRLPRPQLLRLRTRAQTGPVPAAPVREPVRQARASVLGRPVARRRPARAAFQAPALRAAQRRARFRVRALAQFGPLAFLRAARPARSDLARAKSQVRPAPDLRPALPVRGLPQSLPRPARRTRCTLQSPSTNPSRGTASRPSPARPFAGLPGSAKPRHPALSGIPKQTSRARPRSGPTAGPR